VNRNSVKTVKTLESLKRGRDDFHVVPIRFCSINGTTWKSSLPLTRVAFSLIEIMVTIALLSFIVLGLLAMFNQTQRAFRSSMTQVDVLEAGRAVTEIIARDMEQMVASQLPYFNTNGNRIISTNFFAEFSAYRTQPVFQGLPGTDGANGPGTQSVRTNVFQDVFFLVKQNLDYYGIGYQVRPENQKGIFGTLYRFSTNRTRGNAAQLSTEFRRAEVIDWNSAPTNMSRIADGVVHFRVRAFDTNGFPFDYNIPTYTNALFRTNADIYPNPGAGYAAMRNSTIAPLAGYPDQLNYYFFSNALPAYVELEIGFLEPHIVDRLKGIGNGNLSAQYQYLSNHVANVHIFRRRIPIRNVDFLAYQ
jgi:type II secretory pathway pseudopilin PulG